MSDEALRRQAAIMARLLDGATRARDWLADAVRLAEAVAVHLDKLERSGLLREAEEELEAGGGILYEVRGRALRRVRRPTADSAADCGRQEPAFRA